MGGYKLSNVGTPTASTDAATMGYVSALLNGLSFHPACRALAGTNVATLSGLQTIDGVSLVATNRVLLTAQTTPSQNGPWIVQSGTWVRPSDWAAGTAVNEGAYFLIDADGTTYPNTKWICTNTGTITIDTTSTTWWQDRSGVIYTNGNGLSLTGVSFAVKTGNGLAFDGSNNVTITPDPNGLLQVTGTGIGIPNGTAGQLLMANSATHPSYQTVTGDVSITSSGVTAVNNASGTGFLKYGNNINNETVAGTVNGTNTTFTLANTPSNSGTSVKLYLSGERQRPGAGNDYTIAGSTITMAIAPISTDILLADYTT
jgi:hypothetical protein